MFLNFFYARTNKPNIHNNTGISSFKNGLKDLFSLTGFFVESKVIEGSHKGKNNFFFFYLGALFLKMYIFEIVTFFFSLSGYPINSIFSGIFSVAFIRFMSFMKYFSSSTIRILMMLFRVVTYCEKLSPINMHDT